MNEHVNFANDEVVVHNGSELLPIFVQDPDDYPNDGLYDIPDCCGCPSDEVEDAEAEVL